MIQADTDLVNERIVLKWRGRKWKITPDEADELSVKLGSALQDLYMTKHHIGYEDK